ncbi:nucleolin-like isoform X1 [Haliotis rufescens]|uniref:nucleolin-like isoform X1 n=2 Tax=Haliotis rufescens TaxID=6454 RepID=UPI00201F8CD8|nr:nucleolin-like isoform X1 [Haliotis rufescens]
MAPQQTKKSKGNPGKVKPSKGKKVAPPPTVSDEDSNSSHEESEEEKPKPMMVKKNQKSRVQPSKKVKVKEIVKDEDDSEDESMEDDTDSEGENTIPPVITKEQKNEDEDEDENEDSDEESITSTNKTAEASDSDEDSCDDSSEDEGEDEEVNGKRKKPQKEKPVKKSKTESTVTVFIANLGRETEAKKLAKLFKKNNIEVTDVRKMPNKSFGYVDLADPSDFDAAVALSGKNIEGQEIRVEKAKEKQKSGSTGSRQDEDSRTIFVKNLAESVTEALLNDMFEDVDSIRMPSNEDGSHRGFAYIVFGTAEQATTALEEKQGEDLEGQAIYLDRPRQKGDSFRSPSGGQNRGNNRQKSAERGSSKILFVRNLSFQLDESSLKQEFENSTSARIMTHADSGKPRGFGFVEFSTADDASKAYDSMQGQEIMGREVFVDFASEKSNGERKSFGGGRGRGGFGGGRGGRGRGGGYGGGRGGGFRGGRGGRGTHKKF